MNGQGEVEAGFFLILKDNVGRFGGFLGFIVLDYGIVNMSMGSSFGFIICLHVTGVVEIDVEARQKE